MTHGCITSPARNRLHSRCGRTSCRIPASSHVLCAVWEQVGHPSGAPNTTCGSITRNAQASKHSPRTCPMNALVAVVSRAYALSTAALSRRLRLVTVLEAVDRFCYLGDMLSAGGGCMAAATARCRCKFRENLPSLCLSTWGSSV